MKDSSLLFLCLALFASFHAMDSEITTTSSTVNYAAAMNTPLPEHRYEALRNSTTAYQGTRYESLRSSSTAYQRTRYQIPEPEEDQDIIGDFSSLDDDDDGYLSRRDAKIDTMLLKHWANLDRDGNGYLDEQEFAYFY